MLERGQRVFIYRNLHKKCWSVRDCKTRRVVAHLPRLCLTKAKFKVSEVGRQQVLQERRKNVHAGVEGEFRVRDFGTIPIADSVYLNYFRVWGFVTAKRVRYNPYKRRDFYLQNGRGIKEADFVVFDSLGRVYI